MKQITTESMATAFQIAAIIFLFSYPFSSGKNGNGLNNNLDHTGAINDSMYARLQLQQGINNADAINTYYTEKKMAGLLYTRLSITVAPMLNANDGATKTLVDVKDNPNIPIGTFGNFNDKRNTDYAVAIIKQ